MYQYHVYTKLLCDFKSTPKSRFNEARFNEIPRFSEQMPAPFYYLTI